MIVSVHIPKTAGTSFRKLLQARFGKRLMLDYGDRIEIGAPDAVRHNERRRASLVAERDAISARYDVIHGHFKATKHRDAFPASDLLCFVRDPYQQMLSSYEHGRRIAEGSPEANHSPAIHRFKREVMSLHDIVETFPNPQSYFVDGVPLDDFALIGLTEEYERSLVLLSRIFGVELPPAHQRENANPERPAAGYEIPADLRRSVDRHLAPDIELYRKARERFEALARKHDV